MLYLLVPLSCLVSALSTFVEVCILHIISHVHHSTEDTVLHPLVIVVCILAGALCGIR